MRIVIAYLSLAAVCVTGCFGDTPEKPRLTTADDITVPDFISDGMVLQRDCVMRLLGTDKNNGSITVSLNGISVRTNCSATKWQIELPAMPAGGPYQLTVSNGNAEYVVNDVHIGDVWLASGQSNMEERAQFDDARYKRSKVRIYGYHHHFPQYRTDGWISLSGNEFSHVAGEFGHLLQEHLGIPIGIICSCKGGTKIANWQKGSGLYNSYIARFPPYAIKGIIWWQGESNAVDYAGKTFAHYQDDFTRLITQWRQSFDDPNLPFIYVQLQRYLCDAKKDIEWNNSRDGYESWPLMRQAQLNVLKLPNTAMAVSVDLTDGDMHPPNKIAIAERLFIAAKGLVYEDVEYAGPVYKSAIRKDGSIIISFDHLGKGLKTPHKQPLEDFQLLDNCGSFKAVTPTIEKNKVVIPVKDSAGPFKVRYGYNLYPRGNLHNSADLPASPFITDFIE